MANTKCIPQLCPQCGVAFLAFRSCVKDERTPCCSRRCASLFRKAFSNLIIAKMGSENPAWKGGKTKSTRGYWYIRVNGKYKKLANIIAERVLGRALSKNEIVHHKNLKKDDDTPDNLEVLDNHAHIMLHQSQRARKEGRIPNPRHPVNRRYSWPDKCKLEAMYESMSLREISVIIGCSFKAVQRHMRSIGVHLRRRGCRSCPARETGTLTTFRP